MFFTLQETYDRSQILSRAVAVTWLVFKCKIPDSAQELGIEYKR